MKACVAGQANGTPMNYLGQDTEESEHVDMGRITSERTPASPASLRCRRIHRLQQVADRFSSEMASRRRDALTRSIRPRTSEARSAC